MEDPQINVIPTRSATSELLQTHTDFVSSKIVGVSWPNLPKNVSILESDGDFDQKLDGESSCFQILLFTSPVPPGTAISYTSAMCQNWQSAWQLLEEAPVVR